MCNGSFYKEERNITWVLFLSNEPDPVVCHFSVYVKRTTFFL